MRIWKYKPLVCLYQNLHNTLDFDTKIYGYDFNMNTSGFELTTSIGYRF